MLELLGQSLFAAWAVVVFEVQRDQLRPWQVFFGLWRVNVGFELGEVVLGEGFLLRLGRSGRLGLDLGDCGRHGAEGLKREVWKGEVFAREES